MDCKEEQEVWERNRKCGKGRERLKVKRNRKCGKWEEDGWLRGTGSVGNGRKMNGKEEQEVWERERQMEGKKEQEVWESGIKMDDEEEQEVRETGGRWKVKRNRKCEKKGEKD